MMSRMQNIIGYWLASLRHYFLMCLFLSSPERLPYNPYAFAVTVVAYFGLGLAFVDQHFGYAVIAARILLEIAMLAAIARTGLAMRNLPHRFPQTFSALVGVNLVMSLAAIPLHKLFLADADPNSSLANIVFIGFMVWNLAVISLIFKRALEISIRLSAMISFSYFVVNLLLEVLFLR
jgi:hypothetical protein